MLSMFTNLFSNNPCQASDVLCELTDGAHKLPQLLTDMLDTASETLGVEASTVATAAVTLLTAGTLATAYAARRACQSHKNAPTPTADNVKNKVGENNARIIKSLSKNGLPNIK